MKKVQDGIVTKEERPYAEWLKEIEEETIRELASSPEEYDQLIRRGKKNSKARIK